MHVGGHHLGSPRWPTTAMTGRSVRPARTASTTARVAANVLRRAVAGRDHGGDRVRSRANEPTNCWLGCGRTSRGSGCASCRSRLGAQDRDDETRAPTLWRNHAPTHSPLAVRRGGACVARLRCAVSAAGACRDRGTPRGCSRVRADRLEGPGRRRARPDLPVRGGLPQGSLRTRCPAARTHTQRSTPNSPIGSTHSKRPITPAATSAASARALASATEAAARSAFRRTSSSS